MKLRFCVLTLFFCLPAFALSGQVPVSRPNGEAYLVDESWFEAQPPFIEFFKFGKDQGLVLDRGPRLCLQDRTGFIWLYDDNSDALIRFDGHYFKYFRSSATDPKALLNTNIKEVVENPNGTLWIRHEAGFSMYSPQTEHFVNYPILPDSAGSLPDAYWQGRPLSQNTGRGIFFDAETKRFVRAFSTSLIDAAHPGKTLPFTLHWLLKKGWQDRDGNIWALGKTPIGNGLFRVAPDGRQVVLYPVLGHMVRDKAGNPDYDPWMEDMCPDETGENIWVGGWRGGLKCFNLKTKRWTQFVQHYRREDGMVGVDLETTLFVRPAPGGCFWLGCTHGLAHFNPKTRRFSAWWHSDIPGSIDPESHDLTDALTDREGRLWLGLGALMVHDPKRYFFSKSPPVPSGRYTAVYHDVLRAGTWMLKEATSQQKNDGGIVFKNEQTGAIKTWFFSEFWNAAIKDRVPLRGLVQRNDDIFIASEFCLYKMNIGTGSLAKIPVMLPPALRERLSQGPSFKGMCQGADGSLWITLCNPQSGIPLLHYYPEDNRWEYLSAASQGFSIRLGAAVFVDRRQRIWIASDHTDPKGLNCYDPNTRKTLVFMRDTTGAEGLPSNLANYFAEDAAGRIWITTEEGLCWFDPERERIYRVPGLTGNYRRLAIDAKNRVWFGGDQTGFYDPDSGKFRLFTGENGLYDPEQPLYARKDGSIGWGLIYSLHADSIPLLRTGPAAYLTDFKVFGRDTTLPRHINFESAVELSNDANFFSLNWSAINFTNPEQDQYAYQLVGVDTGWVYCGLKNVANYTKVSPGHYLFRLKAANRDGIWGPEKTLQITVLPAWYQTNWFKLLIFGLVAAALYGLYRARLRQIGLVAALQQKETEMRRKEAEFQRNLAEAQLSALRAQMNPHFIFNSLNSINRFIQMSEPDVASNFLTKFSRLIRLILDNSRENVIPLSDELEACRLYLDMETLRFAGQFSYRIDIDPSVQMKNILIPPLLVQPYLENAIWHGLMQKEDPDKKLSLNIQQHEQEIMIVIEDNGVGREKAQALKSKSASRQKSHGLHLTQERMALFRQFTGISIAVQISDVQSPENLISGTKVEIIMQKTR